MDLPSLGRFSGYFFHVPLRYFLLLPFSVASFLPSVLPSVFAFFLWIALLDLLCFCLSLSLSLSVDSTQP